MTVRTRATTTVVLLAVCAAAAAALAAPARAAAPPATLQASVTADGSLSAGSTATAATSLGPGVYEVTFDRDVRACAFVATTVNASSQATQAFTAGGHGSVNGVYVETKNQGGGLSPAAFDLVVDCGSAATPFAVVGYDGALVRGTSGASVSTLGPGRFAVQFPTTVAACVPVAGVGDPSNALVFDPTNVSTGNGTNIRTVNVETKNPGGGLQAGVPFHLAVFCPGAAGTSAVGVRADGTAARSVGDILSFRSAGGRFTLVTRDDVSGCATVATRSSLTRAVPFTPTTVETTTAGAPNTVALQVRTLLAGGGTFTNQSFTAAVVC